MSNKNCRIKIFYGIAGLIMAALALSGCAQKMTSNTALDEAKIAYQAAQANPTVMRSAPLELKKAEMALTKAEETFQKNGELAVVEHQAYLSKQHSAIAQEIGNQKMAEAAIEQASAERNKVLLEARATEATLAQKQAAAEKAAAMKAMEEAQAQKAAAEKASMEAAEQRMAAEKAMAEALAAQEKAGKLEQEIAELQAVKADRGLVMTLGDVVFDVNKADLKPGGILTVDKLAAFLAEYPTRRVMIEGFTDSTGDADYNQGLSERRALAVRNALLEKDIESTRVDFRGYGEEFPVATNTTAAGRQMNRRVEIIISDEAGVIPVRSK
jgi:outer membrane protein OmpA-like peptidoglycan-associated protein